MKVVTKRVNVVSLRLVRERGVAYPATLTGPESVVATARELLEDADREQFLVLHLDQKHRVVSAEVAAIGTATFVVVTPAMVFRGALVSGAVAIAVAHNHPSGNPEPSQEDFALTKALLDAGDLLGVRVVDHVVIGHERHVSIRERRPELRWG